MIHDDAFKSIYLKHFDLLIFVYRFFLFLDIFNYAT